MGFGVHVLVFGLLGVVFGVGELLAPTAVLAAFGVAPDTSAVLMTRLGCGPLNVGFGLAAALSFRTRDPIAQRAVLTGGLGYALTAAIGSVSLGLADPANRLMMWSMLGVAVPLGANATRLLVSMRGRAGGDPAVSRPALGG